MPMNEGREVNVAEETPRPAFEFISIYFSLNASVMR